MVIEILGTRVIGPVFGVSLYVWSALIAVTLFSLALGYYYGGVLSDRNPTARLLAYVLIAAGALLAIVPVLEQRVLLLSLNFGLQAGPLLAGTVLFGPPLTALGMVAPVSIRLVTRDPSKTGYGVGSLSAVSTAGSLVATLATPYVLIPALETNTILYLAATALLLAGVSLLVRRHHIGSAGVLVIPVISSQLSSATATVLPRQFEVLERAQSPYSLVEVIDDNQRAVRLLRADHSIIGGHFQRTKEPCFAFVSILETVASLRPSPKSALVIGLGAGTVPRALEARGLVTDTVEIDPAVAAAARAHFDFVPNGKVFVEDARTLVQRIHRKYDVIVHDTFTGGTTPEHLLTVEFIARLHDRLTPHGVLALNFPGHVVGPDSAAAQAVERTLRASFPIVHIFPDEAPTQADDATNLIFFAADDELDFSRTPFAAWEVLQHVPNGPVIIDERNPLGRMQLESAAEHFRAMGALLPASVWVH